MKQSAHHRAMAAVGLQAVILDVDGTLYRQSTLRRRMLVRFLRAHISRPADGLRNLRAIAAYRRAQEFMRASPPEWADIALAQAELACHWTGMEAEALRACVVRWMEQEPLEFLGACVRQGVREFLECARELGLRRAAYSDYPAAQKLRALGLAEFFQVVVTAQDPAVQRFKPHPRGLEVTLERLGLTGREALYIGDRPEVDAVAAEKAGVRCAILGRRNRVRGARYLEVAGFQELRDGILGN